MLWVFLWLSMAWAQQLNFRVKKAQPDWSFQVSWLDSQHHKNSIQYSIPAQEISADRKRSTQYVSGPQLQKKITQEVNRWARTVNSKRASVRAQYKWPGVTVYSTSGRDQQRKKLLLEQAQAVAERKRQRVLKANGFMEHSDGIYIDYTRVTQLYSPKLVPLLRSLRQDSPRALTEDVLGFVQSIPYDKKVAFRRPLALLADNAGDCDSKSVLMLSLLRAADVNVPLVIVLVSKHAFVGVGIPANPGEQTAEHNGIAYVLMEPVGPAVVPMGTLSKRSQRALRKGKLRFIEVN